MPPNWMESLLLHAGGIRTIAVHYEPVAPSRSRRIVDRDSVKLTTDEEQRTRTGFRITARHCRAESETLARRSRSRRRIRRTRVHRLRDRHRPKTSTSWSGRHASTNRWPRRSASNCAGSMADTISHSPAHFRLGAGSHRGGSRDRHVRAALPAATPTPSRHDRAPMRRVPIPRRGGTRIAWRVPRNERAHRRRRCRVGVLVGRTRGPSACRWACRQISRHRTTSRLMNLLFSVAPGSILHSQGSTLTPLGGDQRRLVTWRWPRGARHACRPCAHRSRTSTRPHRTARGRWRVSPPHLARLTRTTP